MRGSRLEQAFSKSAFFSYGKRTFSGFVNIGKRTKLTIKNIGKRTFFIL